MSRLFSQTKTLSSVGFEPLYSSFPGIAELDTRCNQLEKKEKSTRVNEVFHVFKKTKNKKMELVYSITFTSVASVSWFIRTSENT